MGIEGIGGQPRPLEGVVEQANIGRASAAARPATAPGAERTRDADTLELSERALDLLRARRAVEAAPDIRAEHVARIKQRLADGTYSVSPDLLARKLLGTNDHEDA